MRSLRMISGRKIMSLVLCLEFLALAGIHLSAQQFGERLTVTGKLTHVMAMGGETTGWSIALDAAIHVDGNSVTSIQVSYPKSQRLQKLDNKRVKATGRLSQCNGVETGAQPLLNLSSIKEDTTAAPVTHDAIDLVGTQWKLEDLVGSGVIQNSAATLAFPEAGKIAGNDSCNRYFGNAEINGDAIKLSPLGSTRMACPEPMMNQETKFTQALQAAERYEWKAPYLDIYCKGFDKPLRFTKLEAKNP